jgi:hypothetical protein
VSRQPSGVDGASNQGVTVAGKNAQSRPIQVAADDRRRDPGLGLVVLHGEEIRRASSTSRSLSPPTPCARMTTTGLSG